MGAAEWGGPLGHTQYLWSPQTPPIISGSVDSKPRPSFPLLQPGACRRNICTQMSLQATPSKTGPFSPRLDSNSRPTGPVRPCQVRPGSPCNAFPAMQVRSPARGCTFLALAFPRLQQLLPPGASLCGPPILGTHLHPHWTGPRSGRPANFQPGLADSGAGLKGTGALT